MADNSVCIALVHQTSRQQAIVKTPGTQNTSFLKIPNADYTKGDFLQLVYKDQALVQTAKYTDYKTVFSKLLEVTAEDLIVEADGVKCQVPRRLFNPPDMFDWESGAVVTLFLTAEGRMFYAGALPAAPLEEYPETIGKARLSVQKITEEFKYSEAMKLAVEQLQQHYIGWRKVRGDGNCYYRAVGVGLLEHYCRVTTPLEDFETYLEQVKAKRRNFRPFFEAACRHTYVQYLEHFVQVKRTRPEFLMKECQTYFQDFTFDDCLVKHVREVAARFFHRNRKKPDIAQFVDEDHANEIHRTIISMGEEAEGITFQCVAKAFRCVITHVTVADAKVQLDTFGTEGPHISLCFRPGHYDLLYTQEQLDVDNYCSTDHSFRVKPGPVQRRFDNAEYTARLLDHLLYLYENLRHLLRKNTITHADCLPSFAKNVANFWSNFQPLLAQGDFQYLIDLERQLVDLTCSNDFACELGQLCHYCVESPALIRLGCGHYYCGDDLMRIYSEATGGLILLTPAEEQTTPVLCRMCQASIDNSCLKLLLGSSYEQYYAKMLERQNAHKCVSCDKVFARNSGPETLCGCVLCPQCFSFSSEENDNACTRCTRPVMEVLKVYCSECNAELHDQVQLNCGHSYCHQCLPTVIMQRLHARQPAVCGVCRQSIGFQQVHKHTDQNCWDPACERCASMRDCSSCGQQISDEIPTFCECLLCAQCFNRCMETNYCLCLVCNGLTIDIGPAEYLGMFDEPRPRTTDCQICTNSFARDQMITLDCDHFFCEDCMKNYLNSKLADSCVDINCPMCDVAINTHTIQSLVSAKDWDLYVLLGIRKEVTLVDCPKCNNRFDHDEAVANCPCGYSFCTKCLQRPHDGTCDEAQIQHVIAGLEAEGNIVSQCPECKVPCLKDDKCEHVTCSQCQTEFCFQCSCYRSPTMAHGNQYHRPQCRFYSVFEGRDKQEKDCAECQKAGRLCKRPQDLKVPRKFGQGEE